MLKSFLTTLFQNLIGMLGRNTGSMARAFLQTVSKPYRYARKFEAVACQKAKVVEFQNLIGMLGRQDRQS